jgi:CDP-glucose 4,6-dehydratase
LRAGNVIGGGDLSENRLIPDLVRAFQTKNRLVVRNPQSTRPWQHVLDPLTGYLLALEQGLSEKQNATYNFGPKETSLKVEEVVRVFQETWNDLSVSFSLGENDNYESIFLELDATHAAEALNWEPMYDQYLAIEKTIQWWEANLLEKKSAIECIDYQVGEYLDLAKFYS